MSMHKRGKRYHDSIGKLFDYIGLLTKERIEIVFDGTHKFVYEAPQRAVISQTLFRTDGCESSGKCCKVAFDLAYTKEGVARLEKAQTNNGNSAGGCLHRLKKVSTTVNGHEIEVHAHLNDKKARYTGQKTCDFLENPQEGPFKDKFICGLHGGYDRPLNSAQPFHCIAPHLVVRMRGKPGAKTGFIGRMQFGRNWRFGCPVEFSRDGYFKKDYRQDLDKLKMMDSIANDIGVSTWIPEMIHWLTSNKQYIEQMFLTGKFESINVAEIYDGKKESIEYEEDNREEARCSQGINSGQESEDQTPLGVSAAPPPGGPPKIGYQTNPWHG